MRWVLAGCALFISAICAAHAAAAEGDYGILPRSTPGVVPVHGDYDWIRSGDYHNKKGHACCGRDDCSVVPHDRVRAGPDGFVLLGRDLSVRRGDALSSEDGKFWLCAYPDGRVRCFFVPPEM